MGAYLEIRLNIGYIRGDFAQFKISKAFLIFPVFDVNASIVKGCDYLYRCSQPGRQGRQKSRGRPVRVAGYAETIYTFE
jgi:hypothetical protein